ncbi:glycosyltransferase [Clostridium lacusfryxellense]|uniref:glycosyltransferase n=1 Tax=Clostridium lacusfryxellense TaxID=205328 RepID=UPI001C0C2FF1|nr:glycosyltransferase [Clostridium lacusfryxellense]MBU3111427.1 glycosyltransferase [Clostridium lacusfryxellense]
MSNQVENGDEVSLLYPGHYSLNKKQHIDKDTTFKKITVYELLNPISIPLLSGIPSPRDYLKNVDINIYIDFLKGLDVEVIHVHTLMGLNKELITAAQKLNIKTIFTSHDYFGICPKVNLIDLQGEICTDYNNGKNCITCNANGYSNSLVTLMQSKTYRILKNSPILKKLRAYKQSLIIKKNKDLTKPDQKQIEEKDDNKINASINKNSNQSALGYVTLRKYYIDILNNIDFIHYNSSVSKYAYEKYIKKENSRVLNITHSNIKDSRIKKNYNAEKPLKITYIGSIEKYKGLYFLLDVLKKLLKNDINNWNLDVYGKNVNIDTNHFMKKVEIKGTYDYTQLENIFKNTDVLIVPSIWYETFGYIALEAFSYGVPVIITDLVGFKDMINPGVTGIIIKASEDELYNNLQSIIKDRERLSYINQNIIELPSIYTMEKHTQDVMELYRR